MERPPPDQERLSRDPSPRSPGQSGEAGGAQSAEGSPGRTHGQGEPAGREGADRFGAGREPSRDGSATGERPRSRGTLETLVERYGPTRGAQRHAGAQDRNQAGMLALGLGIASVAVLLPSFGALFFLSLPLGLAAIVLGVIGKRKVARKVAARHGRSAHAGLVLGAISTALSLLAALLIALGVAGLAGVVKSVDEGPGGGPGAGDQRDALEQRSDQQRRELEERSARQRQELEQRAAQQRDELRRRSQEGR